MFEVTRTQVVVATMVTAVLVSLQGVAYAQPFGVGVFGEDVPFGDETSLSIGLSNEIDMDLDPDGSLFRGTGSHDVTVTSTDVIGYDLYVHATTDTFMDNGTDTVDASANSAPDPLAVNSWGYNTSSSTSDFIGMSATQDLINSGNGPFKEGDSVTVTYGALLDITKSSGTYSVDVTYTAVGQT